MRSLFKILTPKKPSEATNALRKTAKALATIRNKDAVALPAAHRADHPEAHPVAHLVVNIT